MKNQNKYQNIPVDLILPNPFQPRKHFDAQGLEELAESIATDGVIQPIEVEAGEDGKYILHHGERRLRASKIAKQTTIPAIIAPKLSDLELLARAVLENLLREDMNIIDEGMSYKALREGGMSVNEIARRTKKAIPSINNALEWLDMPQPIQDMVAKGTLYKDRKVRAAILSLPTEKQVQFARRVAEAQLSVPGIQDAAQNYLLLLNPPPKEPKRTNTKKPSPKIADDPNRAHALRVTIGNYKMPSAGSVLLELSIGDVCMECPLSGIAPSNACRQCPLAKFVEAINKRSVSDDAPKQ